MAYADFSARQAAFSTLIEPAVTTQINRAVVLAPILGVVPADNKNVSWDVKLGTATPTTAVISDGEDVSDYNADTKKPAVLQYGELHDAFGITGRAMAGAIASGSPQQLANLFLDENGDSIERLASAFGDAIYNGDGTTDNVHGLYATVSPIGDTGIYAGLDRATYTQWKGSVVAAGGAAPSQRLLRALSTSISKKCGFRPDLFITDQDQFAALGEQFANRQQFVTDTVNRNDGVGIVLKGGFNMLKFDGATIVEDVQHPAGKITALNTSFVRLRQLMQVPDGVNDGLGMVQIGGTPEEQLGAGRIKMAAFLMKLAKTGNLHKFAYYIMPQLQVKRPNTCGYISGLQTSF